MRMLGDFFLTITPRQPRPDAGQDRLGEPLLAVLHEHLGHVQVDADPERHREGL